jgi:hypothetical protein
MYITPLPRGVFLPFNIFFESIALQNIGGGVLNNYVFDYTTPIFLGVMLCFV